jgi:hypothetical protein
MRVMSSPESPAQSTMDYEMPRGAATPHHRGAEPPPPRRSLLAGCAIALGVFSLALAAFLPLYIYPRLAVMPDDPQQGSSLTASDATVLVPDATAPMGARVLQHQQLTSTTFVSGARQGDSVIWDFATQVFVKEHGLLNAQVERASFNRRTAEPTNCCGDRLVTDQEDGRGQSLRHNGYTVWPFDVQKRSYKLWDISLQDSKTAQFDGTETKDGVRTYRFRSNVPLQTTGKMDLPGAFFGLPAPSVKADQQYADTTTAWIEPATGAVIAMQDKVTRQFAYQGRTITAFDATLVLSTPASQLAKIRSGARVLPLVRGQASWVLIAIGLVATGGGIWLRNVNARRRSVS